jgi:hypothetical protein
MQWAGSTRILLDGAKAAVGCGRAVPALDYVGSASTAMVGGTEDTHRSGASRLRGRLYAPGISVSLVARQHGVAPNQVFKWRQLKRSELDR